MMTEHLLKAVSDWVIATKDRLKDQVPSDYVTIDGQTPFLLAVSGGVDSMVLLDLFDRLQKQGLVTFSVIHINHQLRPESDMEQQMVIDYCESRDIPIQVVAWDHDDPTNPNRSELAAREFRYAVFERMMMLTKSPFLVTAHHQNDQAETVLMRLVHGGRLKSIAGIHPYRPIQLDKGLTSGYVLRPLLTTDKADLYAYAATNNVPFSEDQSNDDLAYTRNRFRQRYLPELEAEDGAVVDHLGDFALAAQATNRFAEAFMDQVLKAVMMKKDDTWHVDLAALRDYDLAEQVLLWQYMFDRTRIRDLAAFTQDGFKRMVAFLQSDHGQAEWRLPGGYRLVKVYDTAYILPGGRSDFLASGGDHQKPVQILKWQDWLVLGDQGKLGWFDEDQAAAEIEAGAVVLATVGADVSLAVRDRRPGDFIRLSNGHRQKLNRFLINEKVPSGIRDDLFVLVDSQQEVWGLFFQGEVLFRKLSGAGSKVLVKF
ncbi:tRNA lysidine(34) synthetase TilS [Aerococcaceae bacterium 50-4]